MTRAWDVFQGADRRGQAPIDVAALYVDRAGPYMDMPGVEPWTIREDARRYQGPHPVVAHPPCADWSAMRGLARDDPERRSCGPRAVEQVRGYGGVLEHPAFSTLWDACDMARPGELPDAWGGWSVEVEQVAWGHRARKRTWIYLVGVDPKVVSIRLGGQATHVVATTKREGALPTMGSLERRLTPDSFAAWLIELARRAVRPAAATGPDVESRRGSGERRGQGKAKHR